MSTNITPVIAAGNVSLDASLWFLIGASGLEFCEPFSKKLRMTALLKYSRLRKSYALLFLETFIVDYEDADKRRALPDGFADL